MEGKWENPSQQALSFERAVALLDSGNLTASDILIPLVRSMALVVKGMPALFAMSAFDVIAFIVTLILLFMALKLEFLAEKAPFVVLLVIVCLGTALGSCFWTFSGTGYVAVGHSEFAVNVLKVTVDIIGRLVQVVFLILFAVFAWVLIGALLATLYPKQKALPKISLAAFAVITFGAAGYSIAMAVVHAVPQSWSDFVLDASIVLLPAVSFLFSAILAIMWLIAWRLISTKSTADAGAAEMKRNAIIFFVGSLFLATIFLAQCVIAALYLTVSFETYQTPLLVLEVAGHVLMVLAVLGYVGTAVISAARAKRQHTNKNTKNTKNNDGYVLLAEEAAGVAKVPKAYVDY